MAFGSAWRITIQAQTNTPNPSFDPFRYREIYLDTNISSFDPVRADESQWSSVRTWRERMKLPRNVLITVIAFAAEKPSSRAGDTERTHSDNEVVTAGSEITESAGGSAPSRPRQLHHAGLSVLLAYAPHVSSKNR